MDITENLTIYMSKKFPEALDLNIKITTKITSGWETEIYCFELKTKFKQIFPYENLAIRIYPYFNNKSGIIREFGIMKWLKAKNYPVPEVLICETEKNPLNRPFIIMEEIKGPTLRMVMNNSPQNEYEIYLERFSELFNKLHNLDLIDFPFCELNFPEITTSNLFEIYLLFIEERLNSNKLINLLPILDWLKEQRREIRIERISLTHGDFHPNNVIVTETGDFIVLDWSASMPVDYRYDLAWTMVLARLYIGEEFKQQVFEAYQLSCGKKIEDIAFFEVIALLRRLSDLAIFTSQKTEKTGIREETIYVIKSEMELITRLKNYIYDYTKINIDLDI